MVWHLFLCDDELGQRVGDGLGISADDVRSLKPVPTQGWGEEEQRRLDNLGNNGPRDVEGLVMTHCVPNEHVAIAEEPVTRVLTQARRPGPARRRRGEGLDSPRAWGVVAAAFAAMFVAFGIAYSYGAFLEEMRADFGVGRAAGATFFSLTSLLYFGLGGLSGAAGDRFGQRRVLLVGAAAFGLGLVATARAGSLGVALAAYGLGVGIGVACAYVPMVALVGAWFERRRTLALGVAVAGIGVGTLVIPPATAALIEAVGWRDAYLVLAAVGVAALGLCALAAAPAAGARGRGFRLAARGAARPRSTAASISRPRCSACRSSCRSSTCRPTPRTAASTRCSPPA